MLTKIFINGEYLMTVKDSHVDDVVNDLDHDFDLNHGDTDWSQEGYLFLVTVPE